MLRLTRRTWEESRDKRSPPSWHNKTIVMGIVERNGNMRAGPIDDLSGANLETYRQKPCRDREQSLALMNGADITGSLPSGSITGASTIFQEILVNDIHHTNTLEGHWSLLKRAIRGTHVHISSKHAWKYVGEFTYRRNFRHSHRAMFDRLVASFSLPRLVET